MLTKSKLLSALQCPKRLWLEEHTPNLAPPMSRAERRLLEQGTEIGALARSRFPGGVLIAGSGPVALHATQAAIGSGAPALFEAAFAHNDVLVRCDVLVRRAGDRWDLIEVKASTGVKPEHSFDLAVQYFVAAGAGLHIDRLLLMVVNSRGCVYPDLDSLFMLEDLTETVGRHLAEIETQVEAAFATLAQPAAPAQRIGGHCQEPNPCPFQAHCWQDVPEHSIFNLPRLSPKARDELLRREIIALADLPADFSLTAPQKRYVECVRQAEPQIDPQGIRQQMARLTPPIHFFDFETDAPPVPRFPGMRPYEQIPFQYSCHVLTADGQVLHYDYLHTGESDPRLALVEALLTHMGPHGSVVVFNAQFERSVLRSLAARYPAHAPALESIIDRLWDQLEIFRHHYIAPDFRGSNSIKRVLPVLVPDLSYKELAVQKGDDAQAVWGEMIVCTQPQAKEQMIADLRAYCRRDTEAMLRIHFHLLELCSDAVAHPIHLS